MDDGRILYLDLRQPVAIPYLLLGRNRYESGETAVVRSITAPGEVVWDIGANVGWYSTLLARIVGPKGRVYAFEPGRESLRMLHASTVNAYPQLRIVDQALSDREGTGQIHVPKDIGEASLRRLDVGCYSQFCHVTTMDDFIRSKPSAFPVFVKCDVEGAERDVLAGASRILSSPRPPIWLIEMNPFASARFGYRPEHLTPMLLDHGQAKYRGFRVHQQSGRLLPLPRRTESIIFNALFVPQWLEDRIVAHQQQYPWQTSKTTVLAETCG
ncbi:MAG: hypothetical protein A2V70_04585 [Planctomycetes bacterium RBG_13_63_9]|nr:MAG: hypothetical protein A2V70_04585 [Planctomycetes bacterium RBG_13_63_9]